MKQKYMWPLVPLLLLLMSMQALTQSNIIDNPGFESGAPGPNAYANFQNIQDWSDRFQASSDGNSWHSADWFRDGFKHANVNAHSGSGYIGMQEHELIQQDVNSNPVLEGDIWYILSVHVYFPSTRPNGTSTDFSDSRLILHFMQNQLSYQGESDATDTWCGTKYRSLNSSGGSGTRSLVIENQLDQYPVNGGWHRITKIFKSPNTVNMSNPYDRVALEMRPKQNQSFCQKAYVLIDDFEIYRVCDHPCVTHPGIIYTSVDGSFDPSQLETWEVRIQNAQWYTLEIRGAGNSTVWQQSEININGLNDDPFNSIQEIFIYWTGLGFNNTVLQSGFYDWYLWVGNCGSVKNSSGTVHIQGNSQFTEQNALAYPADNPVNIELADCCVEQLQFHDPKVFPVADYRASDFIVAQNDYKLGSFDDIDMQAGSRITLRPGFEAKSGANYRAHIANCTVVPGAKNGFETSDQDKAQPTMSEQISNNISIAPQPVGSQLTIRGLPKQNLEIHITDIMGRRVFSGQSQRQQSLTLNLQRETAGVYILTLRGTQGQVNRRFVKSGRSE